MVKLVIENIENNISNNISDPRFLSLQFQNENDIFYCFSKYLGKICTSASYHYSYNSLGKLSYNIQPGIYNYKDTFNTQQFDVNVQVIAKDTQANSQSSNANPNTTATDPNIATTDPNTISTDPNTISTDPNIATTYPNTTATDLNTDCIKSPSKIIIDINENIDIKAYVDYCVSKMSTEPKSVKAFTWNNMNKSWASINNILRRDVDTVFMNPSMKDNLFKRLELFFADRDDYINYSMIYKYNILLHGKYGSGKTSLCNAIATKYDMNLYLINTSYFGSDNEFVFAMNMIAPSSLVLFEDIDCSFTDRKLFDVRKNNITLTALLNYLDGMNSKQGIINILTANTLDNIDDAMLRSKRIDLRLEFKELTLDMAEIIFINIAKTHNQKHLESFKEFIQNELNNNTDLYPSKLINFLFYYRNVDDITMFFSEFNTF